MLFLQRVDKNLLSGHLSQWGRFIFNYYSQYMQKKHLGCPTDSASLPCMEETESLGKKKKHNFSPLSLHRLQSKICKKADLICSSLHATIWFY